MTHTKKNPAAEGARAAGRDDRFNKAISKIRTWSNAMARDPDWDVDRMALIARLESIVDGLGADGACLRCGELNSKTRLAKLAGDTRIVHERVRCSCSALHRSGDAKTARRFGHR